MYKKYLIITLMMVCHTQFSYTQDFDKTFLTFDLTFNNPNSNSLHVTEVGVKSELVSGDFMCMSKSRPLIPVADYIVRFHVEDKVTTFDANPILQIQPKGSARFRISIIPEATGACGYWSTNVSAIVRFNDGTEYLSKPELITSKEFEKFKRATSNPSDEEIVEALQHRDVGLRRQAIKRLANSTLDKNSKIRLLGAKLKDNDTYVRQSAAEIIGELKLVELTNNLIENLENTKEDNEISSYCEALGNLEDKSIKVTDLLLNQIVNLEYRYYFSVTKSIMKIDAPHVPKRVLAKAKDYINWTKVTEENPDYSEKSDRYSDLLEILIKYQDKKSIPHLQKILLECQNKSIVTKTIYEISMLTNKNKISKNPFILSFKKEFKHLTKHSEDEVRISAIDLVCATTEDEKEVARFLKNGINDENKNIRMAAAEWIGYLNLQILIPEIKQRVTIVQNRSEKAIYCKVLKQFKQKCN